MDSGLHSSMGNTRSSSSSLKITTEKTQDDKELVPVLTLLVLLKQKVSVEKCWAGTFFFSREMSALVIILAVLTDFCGHKRVLLFFIIWLIL